MASAATPGLQYDVSESAGVKVANREVAGPTGTLALVAKAGSRYQPFPGFSDALELFAFKVGFIVHLQSLLPISVNWDGF
jgi:ubiquinol-cytochrome c reductase core subunit 2